MLSAPVTTCHLACLLLLLHDQCYEYLTCKSVYEAAIQIAPICMSVPQSVPRLALTCEQEVLTRGSAIAEEPRDALRQLKYYGHFLTELLTRSSANPEQPCEHNVS